MSCICLASFSCSSGEKFKGRIENFFSGKKTISYLAKNYLGIAYKDKTPSQLYHEGLHSLLTEYAESCIKPVPGSKDYSMSYRHVRGIIKDYEELMQARHEKLNPGQPREKYNGDLQQLVDGVKGLLNNSWDTSLVDSWAARIKDGTYDISDLRKATRESYKDGKSYFVDYSDPTQLVDRHFIVENGDEYVSPGEDVAIMRDAMKKVINSRSTRWYWNPLNWWQAIKESMYMRELHKQVTGPKGNLSTYDNSYKTRASNGLINGDDRKKLYDMLKTTEKALTEQAQIREHRRLKEEEAKKAEEAKDKEGDVANATNVNNEGVNKDNVIVDDKQNEPAIEQVKFGDDFKEPTSDKSPQIKENESLSKDQIIQH